MQTDALAGSEALADSDRRSVELRYLTTHFKDLQGLRLAPFWTAVLILSCAALAIHRILLWERATAAIAIVLVGLATLVWSNGWYDHHYGRVIRSKPMIASGFISILHPEARPGELQNHSAGFVTYILMALFISPQLFHRFDGRFGSHFGMLCVIIFVVPRCLYSTTDNTLIRLRRVLSIAGATCVSAMYLCYLFALLGIWSYLAGVCAILLVLDLYDHWLFTRLLSGGPAERSYE